MSTRLDIIEKRLADLERQLGSNWPASQRIPEKPEGACPVCGMTFTDPMGRPIAMGYVCPNLKCPRGWSS